MAFGRAEVVDADVGDAARVARMADERRRQMPSSATDLGDGIVRARRDDDGAVDEAAAEVLGDAVAVALGVDDEADQLVVGVGERALVPEQDAPMLGSSRKSECGSCTMRAIACERLRHQVARGGVAARSRPRGSRRSMAAARGVGDVARR